MKKSNRIAIVYDWMDKWGGAERVLLALNDVLPEAVFFTSYWNSEKAPWAKGMKIRTSFMNQLPGFIKNSRLLSLPLYPIAFESFDFSDFDVVISVTSSFSKGIITKPSTVHICYLLTPTRFLWTHQSDYFRNRLARSLAAPYLSYLRKWDYIAAQRPDHYIAISKAVQNRLKKYYRRDSEVIYPPFDIEYWQNIKSQVTRPHRQASALAGAASSKIQTNLKSQISNLKFFLVVSRLEPYKRVDLVIRSFKQLNDKHLVVVGTGSELGRLKKVASSNVKFLHNLSDHELAFLYQAAQAVIIPQEEDFGFVPLEAQFFGCPVIAYRGGGAFETVVENKIGLFFDEQTGQSLTTALEKFQTQGYNLHQSTKKYGPKNVDKFDKKVFEKKFLHFLKSHGQP